LRRRQGWGN